MNRAALMLRSSASQPLLIWKHTPDLVFTGASDCAGAGTARENGAQGAWIAMAADKSLLDGHSARVSPVSWRSTRVKRVVSSTLAGETLALSACLAEMEWLQVLFRDVFFHDIDPLSWGKTLEPFAALLREDCTLRGRQDSACVVDAKSVFDVLIKNSAGSKQDKRTAIDLCIIRDSLRKAGCRVRWVPHWAMVSDGLTKADVAKSNAALEQMLRTGRFRLLCEKEEMVTRAGQARKPGRSKLASARMLATR